MNDADGDGGFLLPVDLGRMCSEDLEKHEEDAVRD